MTLRRVGDVARRRRRCTTFPRAATPTSPPLDVLASILGAAPSGRLYKALVETRKATSVAAGACALHDPGVCRARAEVPQGRLDSTRSATSMLDVHRRGRREGRDAEEVERAPSSSSQAARAGGHRHQPDRGSAERLGRRRATGGFTSCIATASRRSRPRTSSASPRSTCGATTARSACSFPTEKSERIADPRNARSGQAGGGLQGARGDRRGRGVRRRRRRTSKHARPAHELPERHQGRPVAEEDARRGGASAADAALWQRGEPQGHGRGRPGFCPI